MKFEQLNSEYQTALRAYAKANGRRWKNKLLLDWMSPRPEVYGILRQFRNDLGPSVLMRLRVPKT